MSESEEEEEERRGSIPFLASRRGSKLQDILKYNQEKKRRPRDKRYRDKQGFVWRRFVAADDELPVSRAPHPKLPSTPQPQPTNHPDLLPQPQAGKQSRLNLLHPLTPQIEKVPSIDLDYLEPGGDGGGGSITSSETRNPPSPTREGSLPPQFSVVYQRPKDPETASLRSNRSENSFQTCSSEPQLNLVPRQVSDNYSAPNERSAQERKASVRALKQQYSANNNGPLGALQQKQNKSV